MNFLIYQSLIIIAVIIALFFQHRWGNRAILFGAVLASAILIDVILLGITYYFVSHGVSGISYLRYPTQWLPLIVPLATWWFVAQYIKKYHDHH